jgi:hypothetical protein
MPESAETEETNAAKTCKRSQGQAVMAETARNEWDVAYGGAPQKKCNMHALGIKMYTLEN